MDNSPQTKQTCRQVLESKGVIIYPCGKSEFVAYRRNTPEGSVDFDHDIEHELESLDFHDYEEVACGRGLYVMGNVDQEA